MPYTHLTQNDRYVISHITYAGFSLREIARRIDRHHTTISRELKRGHFHQNVKVSPSFGINKREAGISAFSAISRRCSLETVQ
jgi:IS30 family transposase